MSFFDRLKSLFGGTPHNREAASNGSPEVGGMAAVEMISCHDALVRVHEYLDGELEDAPEAQVKAHFDMCQECYPHLHLETVCRDAIRRAASSEAAPQELRARILELLSEEGADG